MPQHFIKGPFKGIEERESFQTEQHLETAINVNLSRGYIEPRPAKHWRWLIKTDGVFMTPTEYINLSYGQLHLSDREGQQNPYLLIVGPSSLAGGVPTVYWVDLNTNVINSATMDACKTADQKFTCGFVDAILPGARFATIITTRDAVYVFSPGNENSESATLRLVNMTSYGTEGGDAGRYYDDLYFYGASPPVGDIVETHMAMTWYAGFSGERIMKFTGDVATRQDFLDQNIVIPAQNGILLTKYMFCSGDPNDPLSINETLMRTMPGLSEITGLLSFKDFLYLFTRDSIWAHVDMKRTWKVSTVGCTAPRSIIQARDKFYFVNNDGIWVSNGSDVQRISDPIGSLFSDAPEADYIPDILAYNNHQTFVGYGMHNQGAATFWGMPWRIDKSRLHSCTAVHYQKANQIWFNVPIRGIQGVHDGEAREPSFILRPNALTIVYDYELNAFTYYIDDNLKTSAFCTDGVYWDKGDTMFVLSSFSDGSGGDPVGCRLETFGHPGKDSVTLGYHVSALSDIYPKIRSTAYVWSTTKLFRDNQQFADIRRPRLDMMSWGKRPTYFHTFPGIGAGGGSNDVTVPAGPQWFMETENAPFDTHVERFDSTGTVVTDYPERYSTVGYLQTHPKSGDPELRPDGTSIATPDEAEVSGFFWSSSTSTMGKWANNRSDLGTGGVDKEDTMQWCGNEWWWQQLYLPSGEINGKWIRLGVAQIPAFDAPGGTISMDDRREFPPPVGIVRSIAFEVEPMETER
tara:strand:+ start:1522 stop:3762 length:2241 start_codon:yes stop_codon:yes gene_type:complete